MTTHPTPEGDEGTPLRSTALLLRPPGAAATWRTKNRRLALLLAAVAAAALMTVIGTAVVIHDAEANHSITWVR